MIIHPLTQYIQMLRGFTVDRKNRQMIDTINGTNVFAVIYSIVETAKANRPKPYEYFKYHTDITIHSL